jgi:type I restriction enzyme S subunit
MITKFVPKLRFDGFSGEWEERSFHYLTSKIGDGIHATPKYNENGEYYFINGNNLVNGIVIVNSETKRVSKDEYQKHKRAFNLNTILFQ